VAAGISPDRIVLNSQQLPKDLKSFCNQGFHFTATSLHQLKEYAKLFPNTECGVRLNPGDGSGMCQRVTTGGVTAGFGIWHEYIPQAHDIAKEYNIKITKIHTHIGGGVIAEEWKKAAQTTLDLVKYFPDATIVNLGGGFKVARMPNDAYVCMDDVSTAVNNLLLEFEKSTGRKMHLEIEPGAFLSANCGWLLSECIDITDTGAEGYNFIRLDTGMNDFMRPTLYGAQHPITLSQKVKSEKELDYVVIGHNCESGDLLTPKYGDPESLSPRKLPECHIGDYVIIGGAGAYCASMRVRGYNSFIEASEIFID
jgi:diaminopimelate decarboxylase